MKIIGFLCVVLLLCIVSAVPAMATDQYVGGGGSVWLGTVAGSTTSVNTSNNVYLGYGTQNNGQNYAAASKNTSGDRLYATGGGAGAASNIYYQAGQTIGSSTFAVPDTFMQGTTTGWSAQ